MRTKSSQIENNFVANEMTTRKKGVTTMTNTKTQKDFAAEREANGTIQDLFRAVRPAAFRDLGLDAKGEPKGKMVYLQVAHYEKETGKTTFPLMSGFIKPEKIGGDLEKFYAGIKKGQLLSIEYHVSGKYNNIWNIFEREAKKAKAPAAVIEDAEL